MGLAADLLPYRQQGLNWLQYLREFQLAGILAMQQRKQALADGLYQRGGNHEPRWSEQDLELLFEPLDA